ncbi:hypothetical protein [Kribbella sp. NPDC051718]|uniref:hypothetical protein n=1 Tax=Kribbella sp. NPDC051718 TaxID=3155168 RepID=UPI00342D5CC3
MVAASNGYGPYTPLHRLHPGPRFSASPRRRTPSTSDYAEYPTPPLAKTHVYPCPVATGFPSTTRRALRAWSYADENGTERAAESVGLPQNRQAFQTAYAEAQMIVTAPVLVLAQQIARGLADAYAILKHREDGTHDPITDTPERARSVLQEVWGPLESVRVRMRADLGLHTQGSADAG